MYAFIRTNDISLTIIIFTIIKSFKFSSVYRWTRTNTYNRSVCVLAVDCVCEDDSMLGGPENLGRINAPERDLFFCSKTLSCRKLSCLVNSDPISICNFFTFLEREGLSVMTIGHLLKKIIFVDPMRR